MIYQQCFRDSVGFYAEYRFNCRATTVILLSIHMFIGPLSSLERISCIHTTYAENMEMLEESHPGHL
jgi:hypothetical protein